MPYGITENMKLGSKSILLTCSLNLHAYVLPVNCKPLDSAASFQSAFSLQTASFQAECCPHKCLFCTFIAWEKMELTFKDQEIKNPNFHLNLKVRNSSNADPQTGTAVSQVWAYMDMSKEKSTFPYRLWTKGSCPWDGTWDVQGENTHLTSFLSRWFTSWDRKSFRSAYLCIHTPVLSKEEEIPDWIFRIQGIIRVTSAIGCGQTPIQSSSSSHFCLPRVSRSRHTLPIVCTVVSLFWRSLPLPP